MDACQTCGSRRTGLAIAPEHLHVGPWLWLSTPAPASTPAASIPAAAIRLGTLRRRHRLVSRPAPALGFAPPLLGLRLGRLHLDLLGLRRRLSLGLRRLFLLLAVLLLRLRPAVGRGRLGRRFVAGRGRAWRPPCRHPWRSFCPVCLGPTSRCCLASLPPALLPPFAAALAAFVAVLNAISFFFLSMTYLSSAETLKSPLPELARSAASRRSSACSADIGATGGPSICASRSFTNLTYDASRSMVPSRLSRCVLPRGVFW